MHVNPPIENPDILQYLVSRYTGEIIERQTSFSSIMSALLDEQIRLPVFCLRTDLGFENTGHGPIGTILCRSATLRLPHTDEILARRIGGAHSIDPVWFRLPSYPCAAG